MGAEVRYEVGEVFLSDDPQTRAAALQTLAEEYRRLLLARWRDAAEDSEGGDAE